MADAHGSEYMAFESVEGAKNDPDAVAIFEGDDGGQIYAVVPVSQIACPETSLERLLADLDKFSWNDPDGRRIYYERSPAGSGVAGGMGERNRRASFGCIPKMTCCGRCVPATTGDGGKPESLYVENLCMLALSCAPIGKGTAIQDVVVYTSTF